MNRNGTLSFLLADHLGSTTITANSSGALAAELRYKGWGENRLTSGTTPTTYRFTGQRQESGLGAAGGEGLYYYGARWYDSTLGRFIQADTIVPNPGNSQSWDRYAYVGNNPLKYIDPSGHDKLCGIECDEGNWKPTFANFGVKLEDKPNRRWSWQARSAIYAALEAVGRKFAKTLGSNYSFADAFRAGFNIGSNMLVLSNDYWGGDGSAETMGSRNVKFNNLNGNNYADWFLRGRNHVVHELGHVFNASFVNKFGAAGKPYDVMQTGLRFNPNLTRNGNEKDDYGFASRSDQLTWQLHGRGERAGDPGEIFADQFLGWTFDFWQGSPNALTTVAASDRAAWMNGYMPLWVDAIASQ